MCSEGSKLQLATHRHDQLSSQAASTAHRTISIDALLAEAGTSNERMLQVIVWLKTMDDFDAMNLAYENWVPEGCAPARACGRSEMASEELLVEFTVTAAI